MVCTIARLGFKDEALAEACKGGCVGAVTVSAGEKLPALAAAVDAGGSAWFLAGAFGSLPLRCRLAGGGAPCSVGVLSACEDWLLDGVGSEFPLGWGDTADGLGVVLGPG